MSENKCDPNLNIQPDDSTPKQVENFDILSSNRQVNIPPVLPARSTDQQQIPSRQPQQQSISFSSNQQSQSRPTSSEGNAGSTVSGREQKTKPCPPIKAKVGGWNMPMTSYGKVKGIPIQPREINCDCYGN